MLWINTDTVPENVLDFIEQQIIKVIVERIDRNNLNGAEYWKLDYDAIHSLVQSFREITTISIKLN